MRQRDLHILQSLEKFKCLTRDQIAALHFKHNSNPHVSANRVLKRLRLNQYITANTDRSFQQYIYFIHPSPIKTDSQKIDHYLMIAQGYIDMSAYSVVNDYLIEPHIQEADFIPDAYCTWLGHEWFIEFQNSVYTTKQLYTKLNKYLEYYESGHWKNQRVLILGKVNLKFEPKEYPFKIKQVKSINELDAAIKEYQKIKLNEFKKEVKGAKIPLTEEKIVISVNKSSVS